MSRLKKIWIFLAYMYAFFGVLAALGIGNATQINTVVEGIKGISSLLEFTIGIRECIVIAAGIVVLIVSIFQSGANAVGKWAEKH